MLAFSSPLLFCACNVDRKQSEQAVKEIGTQVEQLTKTITEYAQRAEVPEEVKKLQQFEYKVLSYPVTTPIPEFEASLNELGKNRWECFQFQRVERGDKPADMAVICKRRPYTPLKYVPKTILGD